MVLRFEERLTRSPEKKSKGFTLALIEESIVRMNFVLLIHYTITCFCYVLAKYLLALLTLAYMPKRQTSFPVSSVREKGPEQTGSRRLSP